MTEPPCDASDASAALTAFLRGIERRGAVFADLQCGTAVAADRAYAVALRGFREQAQHQPFVLWQRAFWRALLAAPGMTQAAPVAAPADPPLALLATLGPGPRAALLLRLVAGLTEADAASVLGVAAPTYRAALQRALPHARDGRADAEAWRALADAVQARLRSVPAERLAHLARLRAAAVQGRRPDLIGPLPPAPPPDADALPLPRPRLRRLLWAGVIACGVALAATFIWPYLPGRDDGDPRITLRPLSAARSPASRFDARAALLTERDFEQLAAAPAAPPMDDPAFYAWYAAHLAQGEGARDPAAGMRTPEPEAPPESAQPESVDAP